MYITISEEDLDSISHNKFYKAPAFVLLVTPQGDTLLNDSIDNIHTRGNSTFNKDKKPYTIKLLKKKRLLGLDVGKRFVLLANYMDKSHIRTAVAFDLAREMGLKAPKYEYLSLYVNSKYQGLYQMTNKVEDLMDFVEDDGFMIEKSDSYKFEIVLPRRVTSIDSDSIIRRFDYAMSYVMDTSASIDCLTQRLDMLSFAKYYLLQEIVQNLDGGINSFFIYASKEDGGRLHAGPVWDFDMSLGNRRVLYDWTEREIIAGARLSDSSDCLFPCLWLYKLLEKESFRNMVKDIYINEISPLCHAYLKSGRMEELIVKLYGEALRDEKVNGMKKNKSYVEETCLALNFLRKRINFLDWYFSVPYEEKLCIKYSYKTFRENYKRVDVWLPVHEPILIPKLHYRCSERTERPHQICYFGTDSIVPEGTIVKAGQILELKWKKP